MQKQNNTLYYVLNVCVALYTYYCFGIFPNILPQSKDSIISQDSDLSWLFTFSPAASSQMQSLNVLGHSSTV